MVPVCRGRGLAARKQAWYDLERDGWPGIGGVWRRVRRARCLDQGRHVRGADGCWRILHGGAGDVGLYQQAAEDHDLKRDGPGALATRAVKGGKGMSLVLATLDAYATPTIDAT